MAKNRYIKAKKKANWDKWIIRINDMRTQIKDLKELYQMNDEEREAFFSKSDVAKTLYRSYSNHQIIITVENMLKEVESDIKIDDRVAVIEKLLLCKKLVWKIACPFKTRLREEYKLRLEKLQDKAQVSLELEYMMSQNMYIIRGKVMPYIDAILYLIKRFESLKTAYEEGRLPDCRWTMSLIVEGLDELPDNPDTNVLRQQYDSWSELFLKLENGSDV